MAYVFDTREDLEKFIVSEVINTLETRTILNCSRQNLSQLVAKGRLKPIKTMEKDSWFFKQDIIDWMERKKVKE